MQIHFDALGGVAGDMVVAALLDAFPEHEAATFASVEASLAPVACTSLAHRDDVLQGRRFSVALKPSPEPRHHDHDEHHRHGGSGEHQPAEHRHWSTIRKGLCRADLAVGVRDNAIAIFEHLAAAEAQVHGIDIEHVVFHEVGAWDSIADIVAAAHLIVAIGADRWSVGPLPLGSGRVMTAHGPLPVPAPATTLLLRGFATIDDDIAGERVTPTGAAILKHLCGGASPASGIRTIARTGIGFGTRILPGLSNCLRVIAFDEAALARPGGHREIGVVEFEVDDQSAEDLAMGLDYLRGHPDIFDVVQMPVSGKKGRMMTHVRVLVRATAMEEAIAACFRETTTIGLRHHVVAGATLDRHGLTVKVEGLPVRVKTVDRPGGRTAKAEADDALAHATHARRAELRRAAERIALETYGEALE